FYPVSGEAVMSSGGETAGRRVLLVGLDGADWDIIDPLIAAGRMPNLEKLIKDGVRARLKTLTPVLSPIIWTSIVTGVGPARHGIVDFLATSRTTGHQIPVTSNMRRVKALWNILTERGLSSGIIGWWASWPAERIDGFIISDRVAYQLFGFREDGSNLRSRTYPEALGLLIHPMIVAPDQVSDADVARFIGQGAAQLAGNEERVRSLKTILASSRTYLAIGMDLFKAYDPDFKAIYFEGTDTVAHGFMRYRPPDLPGVTPEEVSAYGQVVDRFYEYQDEALGRVLELADDRTTVIVCSDHGFRTGANRPQSDSRVGMGAAADWHRKFGILVMKGPGVKRGITIEDASVLDVTPTILAALGLPAAADMEGRFLSEGFDSPSAPQSVATYETAPAGEAGEPVGSALDGEIIEKLTALGYVSQEGTNALNNTGITLLERGRYSEAADTFRRALAADPSFLHARINLGRSLMLMKEMDAAIAEFTAVLRSDPSRAEVNNLLGNIYMDRGDTQAAERFFLRALELEPRATDVHNSLGLLYAKTGKMDQALREYEKVVEIDPDYAEGFNNIGLLLRDQGESRKAIEMFERAIRADAAFAGSYNNMGLAYQDLHLLGEARAAFERGLKVDADNAVMLNNLGTIDLAENKLEAARDRFQQAITADPTYPSAYNNLGAALGMLGKTEEGFEQYLKAVELDPNYADARFNLARYLLAKGKSAEATEMLERLLKIDPRYGKAHLQLAIIQTGAGDLAAALEHATRAASVMGNVVEPHNLLAEIYLRQNRRDDAVRELKISLTLNAAQPHITEMLDKLSRSGG
ncbi:MAG TPA: tetratricopeptide repeat protein, partial [Candidatus Polarisedimenticolia bacterium]|nr:tetratricopeptide repeat protein [Candidatus Polarisedimenticolia bacterium]